LTCDIAGDFEDFILEVASLPSKCALFAALRMTTIKQNNSTTAWGDKQKGNDNDGWGDLYIPTHRDETAMDGAPGLLWLLAEITARTEADPLRG
jgi:hypothetical protein